MNVLCCSTFPFPSPADKDLEEKTMTAVGGTRKRITAEIHELSERLKTNREAVQRLKEQIEEVEGEEHGT